MSSINFGYVNTVSGESFSPLVRNNTYPFVLILLPNLQLGSVRWLGSRIELVLVHALRNSPRHSCLFSGCIHCLILRCGGTWSGYLWTRLFPQQHSWTHWVCLCVHLSTPKFNEYYSLMHIKWV